MELEIGRVWERDRRGEAGRIKIYQLQPRTCSLLYSRLTFRFKFISKPIVELFWAREQAIEAGVKAIEKVSIRKVQKQWPIEEAVVLDEIWSSVSEKQQSQPSTVGRKVALMI